MKENNMTSFEEVNQTELELVEGGIGPFVAGFIIGAAFVAGVAVGLELANRTGDCPK
jgi:lactobin A/cerein 7B family class IIb bacteriocin